MKMTTLFRVLRAVVLLCLGLAAFAWAQAEDTPREIFPPYTPSADNLKAREWFQAARFGMFIHWGVYSVPGRGEWVMENEKIPIKDYEKFAPQFNPVAYDAEAIVRLAQRAGMKYITITARHHDGFSMWPTRQNHWNIADATPYGKDPLKLLTDAARRAGIKVFFYYSQLDWHHTDYFPLGRTGHASGRPGQGDWNRYLDFMNAQLTELLTQYGDLAGIWFDGMWDKPDADWQLARTYALIHRLQPAALIGSNHHNAPLPGEDFQMFEKELPGATRPDAAQSGNVGELPLEMAETISWSWGYNKDDDHLKTRRTLIQYLVKAAGANANFLLNIGPTGAGAVPPQFIKRLEELGDWLKLNGEAIYGTRGGPIFPRPWGVTTQQGTRIYVHVLDWQEPLLLVPNIAGIRSARSLATGAALEFRVLEKDSLILQVPPSTPEDEADRIIVLER